MATLSHTRRSDIPAFRNHPQLLADQQPTAGRTGNKNATLAFVAMCCGALLAAKRIREVRTNPTRQSRVVFGCNHISHFERNANNSASRYRNRCALSR